MTFLKHFAALLFMAAVVILWVFLALWLNAISFWFALAFMVVTGCAWIAALTSNDL